MKLRKYQPTIPPAGARRARMAIKDLAIHNQHEKSRAVKLRKYQPTIRRPAEDGISRGAFSGFHAHLVAEVMVAAVGRVSRPDFLAEARLSMSEAFDECSRLIRLGLARTNGKPNR